MRQAFLLLVPALMLACACKDEARPAGSSAGRTESAAPAPPGETKPIAEHSVIVVFRYGLPDLTGLREVEKKIEAAILEAGVGEYDGNEIAATLSDGRLYMYGPDADKPYAAVRRLLERRLFYP